MTATLLQLVTRPLSTPALGRSELTDPAFSAVAALILWVGCLIVGLLGFVLPYSRPAPPAPQPPPVQAQLIQVRLTSQPLPVSNAQPLPLSLSQPPPLSVPSALPAAPAVTAVASPALVAFALPVDGPVAVVEPAKANFSPVPIREPQPAVALPVQTLVYGQGEGLQPAPEYPLRARREGQEGVVRVRFFVAESGRVLSAEAAQPSPWQLLNDSALRVVRERWRFSTGPLRHYEVAIRFQLTN